MLEHDQQPESYKSFANEHHSLATVRVSGEQEKSNTNATHHQITHQPTSSATSTTTVAKVSTDAEQLRPGHADGQSAVTEEELAMAKRSAKQHKKWNRRMKIFFCCLGYKKNKESIADVASIFAEFYSDLNAPSSDIAAGFVLLSKYQAAQRQWILKHSEQMGLGIDQYLSGIPIKADTKFIDISTAEDSHLINDLIYYMNYSLAIFGWPLQVMDDPCMLCCIYPYLRLAPCCSGSSRKKVNYENEKETKEEKKSKKKRDRASADCKKNIEKDKDKKPEENNNKTKEQPIVSEGSTPNNDTKAQVNDARCNGRAETLSQVQEMSRSIPGRLNNDCDFPIILEDNCCSCNAASAERRLAQHNYEIIYISYKSNINVVPFLVAADHAKRTIVVAIRGSMSLSDMVTDMNGTVDKLPIENCPDDWLCHRGITRAANYVKTTLLEEHILDRAFNCRPDLGSQEYGLLLCGHSLGAGAAGILGVLLRRQYPTLKAYLYSPPGGILSLPVVEYTKEFAVGIILGNDTVARLGVAQMERLRYHTLLSLKSVQKSPGRILARALCPSICVGSNHVDYDPDQSIDLLHGTDGRSFDYNNTKIPFQVQPQVLYVPGRLIHVVKNYSFKSKTQRLLRGPIYQAVWTDNTNYDRVMISEGMFFDHLPTNLMHAMKMLFSRTLPVRRDSKLSGSAVVESTHSTPSKVQADTINECHPAHEIVATMQMTIQSSCDADVNDHDDQKSGRRLARAKNVIKDDDNNNNQEDVNNNNIDTANEKLYPNLERRARSAAEADSKRSQHRLEAKDNSLGGVAQ